MMILKTHKRILEIDFDNKTFKDYALTKDNWERAKFITSTITYEITKKELRKQKFKRIKENAYEK